MVSPLPVLENKPLFAHGDTSVTPAPEHISRLVIYVVKPSRYDDDGYLVRHWRGVLPSNTLSCLAGLTDDVVQRKVLGKHLNIRTVLVDESVERIPRRKILTDARRKGTRTVVCLAGVQTNQFARATDIALEYASLGVRVMIGGFHVSGMTAMFPEGTPDIARLTDAGVTVVAGEVEDRWAALLSDVVNDRLQPSYNFLATPPELKRQPVPRVKRSYMKRFAVSNLGTIDTSRGCPFSCTFCTIINVQGRKMRCREANDLRDTIIENYNQGINFYFFTDDNFARNKNWESILDLIIDLNNEGRHITFMMQVDVRAYKIPGFVEKSKKAGCSQVFVGMESINPDNLKAAGKTQNDVSDYAHMVEVWHEAGVAVHVGYIIGFPFDTPESVADDVRRLADEMKVDQASFFMLTPLPGSVDHKRMVENGEEMDADFNRFDSFHAATNHPRMTKEQWFETYRRAWRDFYRFDRMRAIMRRTPQQHYWNVFTNFMWYKNSFLSEDAHPMVTGFIRRKKRCERRPGMPREDRWSYFLRRIREIKNEFVTRWSLSRELQELWLQTRRRTEVENRVADALHELALQRKRVRFRIEDWKTAYSAAQAKVPAAWEIVAAKLNVLSLRWTYTRQDLDNFWRQTRRYWECRAFHRINWPLATWYAVRDAVLSLRFALHMALRLQ